MRFLLVLTIGVAPLLLAACDGGSSGTDVDPGTETELFKDDHSPAVISGTVTCPLPGESVVDRFLIIDVVADDPQGADTLKAFGHTFSAVTKQGAQEIFSSSDVVCKRDEPGKCVGSVNATNAGIDCVIIDRNDYFVSLIDIDGNASDPFLLELIPVTEPDP